MRWGGRTNFQDLNLVWERERERVNRDALTRLKTPGGVGGYVWKLTLVFSNFFLDFLGVTCRKLTDPAVLDLGSADPSGGLEAC